MKTSEIQQLLVENKIPRHSGKPSDKERGKEILKKKLSTMEEYLKAMAILTKWVGI